MQDFRLAWKAMEYHDAVETALYCILKAYTARGTDKTEIAKRLLVRSFTPITNHNKLNNGMTAFSSLKGVLSALAWGVSEKDFLKFGTVFRQGQFGYSLFENVEEVKAVYEIVKEVNVVVKDRPEELTRYYCYVFVDAEGVTPEQMMVQAAHATMVAGRYMDRRFDPRKIFYQIVVKPRDVKYIDLILKHGEVRWHHFIEPDLGNRVIASASDPIRWDRRDALRQYPLLTFAPGGGGVGA